MPLGFCGLTVDAVGQERLTNNGLAFGQTE